MGWNNYLIPPLYFHNLRESSLRLKEISFMNILDHFSKLEFAWTPFGVYSSYELACIETAFMQLGDYVFADDSYSFIKFGSLYLSKQFIPGVETFVDGYSTISEDEAGKVFTELSQHKKVMVAAYNKLWIYQATQSA